MVWTPSASFAHPGPQGTTRGTLPRTELLFSFLSRRERAIRMENGKRRLSRGVKFVLWEARATSSGGFVSSEGADDAVPVRPRWQRENDDEEADEKVDASGRRGRGHMESKSGPAARQAELDVDGDAARMGWASRQADRQVRWLAGWLAGRLAAGHEAQKMNQRQRYEAFCLGEHVALFYRRYGGRRGDKRGPIPGISPRRLGLLGLLLLGERWPLRDAMLLTAAADAEERC